MPRIKSSQVEPSGSLSIKSRAAALVLWTVMGEERLRLQLDYNSVLADRGDCRVPHSVARLSDRPWEIVGAVDHQLPTQNPNNLL